MIEINKYLDGILDDFEQYISSDVELCNLKKVHFDAGKVPDYSDIHSQQLYLLRYCYAYAFEYKQMYQMLRDTIMLNNPVTVTSVGCGNMVDYWALAHSVGTKQKIYYRGVDFIDWNYKFSPRFQDRVDFFHQDAVQYFHDVPEMSSDIYIFPKSISELPTADVNTICDTLHSKHFCQDTISFLFSLRTDEGSLARDLAKTKLFYNAMRECGFQTDDSPMVAASFNDKYKDQKICDLDHGFRHPWRVVNFLKDLHTHCVNYDGDCCEDDCESRLDRWPVLKCKKMMWQLFQFRRGNGE